MDGFTVHTRRPGLKSYSSRINKTTKLFDNMKKTSKNKEDAAASNHVPAHDAAPFEIKDLHKKALLTLLHCHHNNHKTLSYPELSLRIETGEKTKGWQCVAWKDLKSHEYIVSSSSDKKLFELSDKGVELASTLASDEELAEFKVPETTKELHDKIKAKLARNKKAKKYGPQILDLMSAPDYTPLTRHEIAAKFNMVADSHGITYGLNALRELGFIVFCEKSEIAQIKASAANEKKRALDESGESTEPPKKKYKSTKKRSGGKPLKLSDTAFVRPARAADAAAVTPDSGKSN